MIFCKNHLNRRATNIKYQLCSLCNFERINGKTKQQILFEKDYQRRQKFLIKELKVSIKKSNQKKKKSVKKISEQQKIINELYKKTCEEIDNTREHICSGCGRNNSLSHSHIISRQDCKNYGLLSLIADKRNITFHCIDNGEIKGCHLKWENPKERKQLLDYKRNIIFIKAINQEIYLKYTK